MKNYERITSRPNESGIITLNDGRRVFPDDFSLYPAAQTLQRFEDALETLGSAISNAPLVVVPHTYKDGLVYAMNLFTDEEFLTEKTIEEFDGFGG
jgi:predicted metallo-beta-lactamase superfamily hydrolase